MEKVLTKEIKTLSRRFGFRSEREFVQDALHEKVRRLKALLFARTAEKVQQGLTDQGVSEEEVIREFDEWRHS